MNLSKYFLMKFNSKYLAATYFFRHC
ncbi:hypothetical protein ACMD2_17342 [Ananas comosus]|uniref:Uncharacterized protein n=1 Tax=Ananas comosus TaxID=4615 RepID=A0A199W928_ANACO|nr:hypothetical protein ACMD2_17342 [Ananas comosus]